MKKILILFTLSFLLISCTQRKEKQSQKDKPEVEVAQIADYNLARYVHSHSSNRIKPGSPLIIRFVKNMVETEKVGQKADKVQIEIEPSAVGNTIWKERNILHFIPKEKWESGAEYQIIADINELVEEDVSIKPLEFKIEIMKQRILKFDADFSSPKASKDKTTYSGTIKFELPSTIKVLQKAATLRIDGKKIKLNWQGKDTEFTFESEQFRRPDEKVPIDFKIDKAPLKMADDLVKPTSLFSLHAMEVILVKRNHQQANPGIEIQFSNPLDPDQEISGYFSIDPDIDIELKRLKNRVLVNGDLEFGKEYRITIKKGIINTAGLKLKEDYSETIRFNDENPQVIFAQSGCFLPSGNDKKIQFRSMNVKSVNLSIEHIFENNLNYFLQRNNLESTVSRSRSYYNLHRVGESIHKEKLQLGEVRNKWLLHELDLANLIPDDDRGLYYIELSFNQDDVYYRGLKGGRNDYYTNPLNRGYYYRNGTVNKPVILSDIGLTVKKGSDKYLVFATDLMNAKPISGCEIKIKSYQNQTLAEQKTNSDGVAEFVNSDGDPFFVEAEYKEQRTILREDEMRWNTSTFDVEGVQFSNEGIRAFTYTERGVYRPGDAINLSLIFRNQTGTLPENHPVKVELKNPRRQLIESIVLNEGQDGFYNYSFSTNSDDPTGEWQVMIKVGGSVFYHNLKIETVVAERLRIEIEPGTEKVEFDQDNLDLEVQANYLFGAPGADLNCSIDAEIYKNNSLFNIPGYRQFSFDNPLIGYKMIEKQLINQKLDEKGHLKFNWELPNLANVPTGLVAKIIINVSEKGGRASKEHIFLPIDPYPAYVGLHSTKDNWKKLGKSNKFQAVLLSPNGDALVGEKLIIRVYHNRHYWWWDYHRGKSHFKNDLETELVKEIELASTAEPIDFEFTPPQYGKYLVEVTHITSNGKGHSAAEFFWASYWGNPNESMQDAGIITLNSDKQRYNPGDKAKIRLETPPNSVMLVSLEKGEEVIKHFWQKAKGGKETIEVEITGDMVPNIYCSVSIIQPHSQTDNDRPIRMYGVISLNVYDSSTRQQISLTVPEVLQPNKSFSCKLQTDDSQQTQFTIAVVDEGLLSLTDFRSPDAWQEFYKKQRLGITTSDTYGYVIGANKGDVYNTFAVGGGISLEKQRKRRLSQETTKRFKPVCLFKGPLLTDKNGAAEVELTMPEYMGAVRIMVVSAKGECYGNAEKTVEVKEDVVILPTLPRMLAPGDHFTIPVEVFATKENLGKVDISISSQGPVKLTGSKQITLNFAETASKSVFFKASIPQQVGTAKIIIGAKSAESEVQSTTDIAIRPLSARISRRELKICNDNETIQFLVPNDGIAGTNEAVLSISHLPKADLSSRIHRLIRYPYGCIEQVTSAVFPQLYLKEFIETEEYRMSLITNNINKGITRLKKFQLPSGAFSYWPGRTYPSSWGTGYAGHFLLAAKESGYFVQQEMIDNWLAYQRKAARKYSFRAKHYYELREQIYRLYLLAKAGKAETGALNYLHQNYLNKLDDTERWILAAAYHLSGAKDIAARIAATSGVIVKDYLEMSRSFGSGVRDKAMILEAMIILDQKDEARKLYLALSDQMSMNKWFSTQTTGYTLMALGKYIQKYHGNDDKTISGVIVEAGGNREKIKTKELIKNYNVRSSFGDNITFTSKTGKTELYVTLNWSGVPLKSDEKNISDGLRIKNRWADKHNGMIDPKEVKQGDIFSQYITLTNTSDLNLENLAVTQILPSGWEIVNERLEDKIEEQSKRKVWGRTSTKQHKVEYEDIRDDRKMWFFDLRKDQSIQLTVKIRAVTVGEFYLPATFAEVMYDNRFKAAAAGMDVRVNKR